VPLAAGAAADDADLCGLTEQEPAGGRGSAASLAEPGEHVLDRRELIQQHDARLVMLNHELRVSS